MEGSEDGEVGGKDMVVWLLMTEIQTGIAKHCSSSLSLSVYLSNLFLSCSLPLSVSVCLTALGGVTPCVRGVECSSQVEVSYSFFLIKLKIGGELFLKNPIGGDVRMVRMHTERLYESYTVNLVTVTLQLFKLSRSPPVERSSIHGNLNINQQR